MNNYELGEVEELFVLIRFFNTGLRRKRRRSGLFGRVRWHFIIIVFSLFRKRFILVGGKNLFCAGSPRTFPENVFDIFGEYDFTSDKHIGEFAVAFSMLLKDSFGSLILLVYDSGNFFIDGPCAVITVRF